jgi:transcriptional regulator with XRE-family HTH domain
MIDDQNLPLADSTGRASLQAPGRRFRGWRFSCLRKERGLSQQDVADRLKLSKSKICLFEKGRQDLPAKALAKLEKWFEVSPEEVKADAEVRSREIALASVPSQQLGAGLPRVTLPWMNPETEAQQNDRLIREHGSVENYLRHSADLQAKDEQIYALRMQLWDALDGIKNLKAQIESMKERDERIKKTLNSAFYGET